MRRRKLRKALCCACGCLCAGLSMHVAACLLLVCQARDSKQPDVCHSWLTTHSTMGLVTEPHFLPGWLDCWLAGWNAPSLRAAHGVACTRVQTRKAQVYMLTWTANSW